MVSDNKIIKGYVKTENMILLVITALALGFVGGVVFSVYRTSSMSPTGAGAPVPMTAQQEETLAALIAESKAHPDDVAVWTRLGHFYFDAEQYENAIEAYETSLKLDDSRPDVWTDLGVMYRRIGNSKKAVEIFDRALAINPNHVVALYNKGIVLMHDLQETDQALLAWEKVLALKPDAATPAGEPLSKIVEQLKKDRPTGNDNALEQRQ